MMKVICNSIDPDCLMCHHSNTHEHDKYCIIKCTDIENSKCIPIIVQQRKSKLEKINDESKMYR